MLKYRVILDFSERDFDMFLSLLLENPDVAFNNLVSTVFNVLEWDDFPVTDVSYRLLNEFESDGDPEKDLDAVDKLADLVCSYARCREYLADLFGVDLEALADGVPFGQEEGDPDA